MKLGNSRDDEVAEQVTRLRCGGKKIKQKCKTTLKRACQLYNLAQQPRQERAQSSHTKSGLVGLTFKVTRQHGAGRES